MTNDLPPLPGYVRVQSLRRGVISLFIAVHLVMIVTWAMPFPAAVRQPFVDVAGPYMAASGLWQAWNMFSPVPLKLNVRVEAEIRHRNGLIHKRDLIHHQEHRGVFARYRHDRYRKWAIDHVRVDTDKAMWPDVARFIVRQATNDASNPIVSVTLIRSWTEISLASLRSSGRQIDLQNESSYRFYTYEVPRS